MIIPITVANVVNPATVLDTPRKMTLSKIVPLNFHDKTNATLMFIIVFCTPDKITDLH
tara:strand:+ start:74 stop:247 length:174 start_codon:yes stop_codon:yes gene_type:complete